MIKGKDQYVPSDAPFEGQPTYRRDYVGHGGVPMTKSLRPTEYDYTSSAPLDENTEYRQEFIKKVQPACVSQQLLSARDPAEHGFELVDTDERGHLWYRHGGQTRS